MVSSITQDPYSIIISLNLASSVNLNIGAPPRPTELVEAFWLVQITVVKITRIHSDTHMLAHASCGCATRVTAMRTGRHIQGRDTGHLPPAGPRSGARSTSRNAEAHDDSTTLRHHSATKTQCTWHVARGGGGEKTESTGRSRSRQARCRTLRRAGSATSCRSKWRPSRAVLWTTAAGSPPTQRSRRVSGR